MATAPAALPPEVAWDTNAQTIMTGEDAHQPSADPPSDGASPTDGSGVFRRSVRWRRSEGSILWRDRCHVRFLRARVDGCWGSVWERVRATCFATAASSASESAIVQGKSSRTCVMNSASSPGLLSVPAAAGCWRSGVAAASGGDAVVLEVLVRLLGPAGPLPMLRCIWCFLLAGVTWGSGPQTIVVIGRNSITSLCWNQLSAMRLLWLRC